jgi:hypothetical protein
MVSYFTDDVNFVVRHHWSLRLQFMTSINPPSDPTDAQTSGPHLLQLAEKDDRLFTYVAPETLYCETFDCHVPITVLPSNQEIPEDRTGMGGFVV